MRKFAVVTSIGFLALISLALRGVKMRGGCRTTLVRDAVYGLRR